uniref:Uncharacterized protein n=1 Tax=Meloidogyne enterolobii TaxID=390850 RepID=A0A6V7XVX4_MELEN|nr:unnamed protein product [Meloidogyne enterolobii]
MFCLWGKLGSDVLSVGPIGELYFVRDELGSDILSVGPIGELYFVRDELGS